MIERKNGKQSVGVDIHSDFKHDKNVWVFSQNGVQSVSVQVTANQFDMLKELVGDHRIVEFYEKLRVAERKGSQRTLQKSSLEC